MEQTEQASDAPVVEEIPEVKAKKPRKPRAPTVDKAVEKLATAKESSREAPPIDVGFWAGLMQTQKAMTKQKKDERYSSFRITRSSDTETSPGA